jgi:hypothetical protein
MQPKDFCKYINCWFIRDTYLLRQSVVSWASNDAIWNFHYYILCWNCRPGRHLGAFANGPVPLIYFIICHTLLQSGMSDLGYMVTYFWWPLLSFTCTMQHMFHQKKNTQAITDTAIFTTLNALIHILLGDLLVMGSWRCLGLGVSSGKNWVSPNSYVWVSPLLTQCTYRFTAYLAGAQCLFIYSIIDVLIALCLVLTV